MATAAQASAPPKRRAYDPLADFVLPGRRRTDHPLVVGTIVLCLGLVAVASVLQIAAVVWAGWQVRALIADGHARDKASDDARKAFISSMNTQTQLLLSHCIHQAATDAQREDCVRQVKPLVPVPGVGK